MAEKLRNKKENADTVLLELEPEYNKLKIGFGESFYYQDCTIWLSETPLQDPTLVPFNNVVVKNDVMEFDAQYKRVHIHFSIYPIYPGSLEVARFLQYLKEHKITISKNHKDSISILIDEDGATIRLSNTGENKRAVITYSKNHGNTFLERFPDPSKRFQIESCSIKENILTVNCKGRDLYNTASDATGYTYIWKLDIQKEFSEIAINLLQAAFLRAEDFGGNAQLH